MVQGLARGPLKAEIRVRIPVSLPKFLQNHSLKFSCREQLGPFWKTTCVLWVVGQFPVEPARLTKHLDYFRVRRQQ